ncbi:MAG: glycosyltransferase, partial [Ilumatobacteraceae bacterium]
VRDEASVIERCLASVRGIVNTWVICDTGSTDGTPELIESLLGDLQGQLHRRPWVDFGHNRTELMRLARGAADYLLLLDADMTLEQIAPLPTLTADAYLLRETGVLDFGVLRLVDGDRDWWFEGSTHEYLCADGRVAQDELSELRVVHHADGGSREGKLLRDLGLLKREVARNSESPRTAFYLAQTYRDMGRRKPALEWYRRRVELGGWEEEAFYAALQEGVLLLEDGIDVAAGALLAAWQRRPTRAEPLYELARGYRERGAYDLAYLFADRGVHIPYPADVLFVHRWIHECGIRLERAIAAAALGRFSEASADLRVLLDAGGLDGELEQFVVSRLTELELLMATDPMLPAISGEAARLVSLAPSMRIGEVRLDVRPSWPAFNPSIAADGEQFRMVVRTANYRIQEGVTHEDGVLRNVNYLMTLDLDLAVKEVLPVADDGGRDLRQYPSRIVGYEDCRLVQVGDRWFASATCCELNPIERREIVLLELDGPELISVQPLHGPNPGRHEKNWMPFVHEDELHFVYAVAPTVILRCDVDNGHVDVLHEAEGPTSAEPLRGGSQGIPLDRGGWLFVVHEVDRSTGTPRYLHRFLELSPRFEVVGVTEPFSFTADRVEFCAGMARHGDELVLSFGVSDAAAGLAVVEIAEVMNLLPRPTSSKNSNSLHT